ncbi:MAG: hypothetical protein RI947_147 [Candidatus Parcubacteria bacterium]|jgi:foldase protein PrsA
MPTKKSTSTHHAESRSHTSEEEVAPVHHKKPMLKLNNWQTGLLIVVALAAALYYFKDQFIVASVNGKPIMRSAYNAELNRMAGKRALDSIITVALIDQEAKKRKVSVSSKEIESEIKKLRESLTQQGQNLDDILTAQNITAPVLRDQMRIQLMLKKILAKDLAVTDKEIATYAETNKDTLPQGGMSPQVKANIKEQLVQQKLNEKYGPWIEDLKAKSKINTYIKI